MLKLNYVYSVTVLNVGLPRRARKQKSLPLPPAALLYYPTLCGASLFRLLSEPSRYVPTLGRNGPNLKKGAEYHLPAY